MRKDKNEILTQDTDTFNLSIVSEAANYINKKVGKEVLKLKKHNYIENDGLKKMVHNELLLSIGANVLNLIIIWIYQDMKDSPGYLDYLNIQVGKQADHLKGLLSKLKSIDNVSH